ncbi:MAG: TIGR00725 family protein [Candidatus Aminicenantales bacterium]
MEFRKKIRIGVIGGSRPDRKSLEWAFEVGRRIAERGALLVCGGLGGVMEEASRGAKQAGGLTIGILPGNRLEDANSYIDIAIVTGLGYSRNSLVAMNADTLIAVDGEYGTLSEIAFGMIYKKKVIGLGTWDIKGVIPASTPEEAVRLALSC